ncbi:MAG: VanZ family protein [Clostridiales bacterium]|nr:VanZ family protein [Clostridiales bacterium]
MKVIFYSFLHKIFFNLVFARAISDNVQYNLTPLWSYPVIVAGGSRGRRVLAQVVMNIVMGIPIGVLLPCALKTRFLRTVLCGFLFSVLIEILQFFTHTGLCEVDDIMHNTLGTVLGYSLFAVIHFIRRKIN